MIKKKLYIWTCDYSNKTGEGNLARLFVEDLRNKKNIIIIDNKLLKNSKYLKTFLGIIYCWYYFTKKQQVAYINYLPLWNFLIFLLLPPNTILGPITGGSSYTHHKNINYFIRKFIFPVFYLISNFIIRYRYKNLIFSTNLLKNFLSKSVQKKSIFNYVLNKYKKQSKYNKSIDFLIYYRQHKNKIRFFPTAFIRNLTKLNFKIHVIGDFLNIKKVKNHGIISNKNVNNLQKKSKYSVAYPDNIYSIFILECLSNNMKIFIDKKYSKNVNFNKSNFIPLDLDKKIYKKNDLKK